MKQCVVILLCTCTDTVIVSYFTGYHTKTNGNFLSQIFNVCVLVHVQGPVVLCNKQSCNNLSHFLSHLNYLAYGLKTGSNEVMAGYLLDNYKHLVQLLILQVVMLRVKI